MSDNPNAGMLETQTNKYRTQIIDEAGAIKDGIELVFVRNGGFQVDMPEPKVGRRLTVTGPLTGSTTTLAGNIMGNPSHTENLSTFESYTFVADGETWFFAAQWAD